MPTVISDPIPASRSARTAANTPTTPPNALPSQPKSAVDSAAHEINNSADAATPFGQLGASRRSIAALAKLGIAEPTLIQTRAIPPLLAGRDVVGQSRTGSGKTIAFGLPLIERLDLRQRQLQALILVPTRELAGQVADVLDTLDGGRGLRVAQLIGGRALGPQRDALLNGAHVAVGAPGRVLDHLRQGNLNLRGLRLVVLDEADQMLDAGFARDVERILAATPRERQLALFTATLPEWTTQIAQRYLHDPVYVDAGEPVTRPTVTVEQTVYLVPDGQRLEALIALLERRRSGTGNTLVFGRTKHGVMRLAKQLIARGYPVAALQGNMSQNARDRVVAEFRAGTMPVLLATNVAARGLDVLSIEQVINFELPESAELFTHRVGRTGRMEREGEAITLITREDLPTWQKMQRDLGMRMPPLPWPQDALPLPPPSATPPPADPYDEARARGPRPMYNARRSAPARSAPSGIARMPSQSNERGQSRASHGGPPQRRSWPNDTQSRG